MKKIKRPLISVVVNTLNEEKNIARCLNSVKAIADEIVVVDMHSEDKTTQIAKQYGAKIYFHKKTGYVEPARNFAISKATGKWILIIDADEKLTSPLAKKLRKIAGEESKYECVLIARKNIIFGKWMKNSRWWPDYLPRFFIKGKIKWPNQIHQQPDLSGKMIYTLVDNEKMSIIHYNYDNLSQFLTRGQRYADVSAQELVNEKGYFLSSKDLLIKPLEEFISRFFVGEAYKDGVHGLALSLLQAWVTLLTYLKVWEMQGYEKKSLDRTRIKQMLKDAIYQLSFWRDDFVKKESESSVISFFSSLLLKIRTWLIKF